MISTKSKISSIKEFVALKDRLVAESKLNDKDRKHRITVHMGTCGIASGAEDIKKTIENEIRENNVKDVVLKISGCAGFCSREPMITIESHGSKPVTYYDLDSEKTSRVFKSQILQGKILKDLTPIIEDDSELYDFYRYQESRVLRNRGKIDPFNIEDYLARDGYLAFLKALEYDKGEKLIEIVADSGLRGRGGAGFPTGKKWELCARAETSDGIKFIVCNGDEGDPGAFMDRNLLESDPHSALEGILIAARAINSDRGYIYIRAEYPLAIKTMEHAINQARELGLLGKNIFGTGFSFDIEIYQGAGAFVCGEETALMQSLQGRRGIPKPRPPFPANSGLYGKPTLISNVETFANIPQIVLNGSAWFNSIGTENSRGTKIFALTGAVNNIGLVEIPMGMTIRDIVFKIGGGIKGGKKFKAVQIGGPSGGCIPEKFLDIPMDYEKVKEAGAIMGSGGMIVLDEDTCMVDLARYFMDFIQDESCGQCVPCRIGTKRMLGILERITRGEGLSSDIGNLERIGLAVKETSLCGLGKSAPNPILSTIKYFRKEYEEHIDKKKCPAVSCKEIVSAPCQYVCPIDTEAPAYIGYIAEGKFKEAFDIIIKDNPLPSVCARVCNHPCQIKCEAGKWGSPIRIKALKRFAVDYAIQAGIYPSGRNTDESIKHTSKKEKIAIIGSGPAGLTAGYKLSNMGYDVTVFESLEVIGGCLAIYIPDYRLPKNILKLDIDNIKNSGVKFRTGTEVGKDIEFSELRNNFSAIFIAAGAHKSRKLNIPGEDTDGVLSATEFLKDAILHKKDNIGKKIGVIGGSNTAVDAARVSARFPGRREVTVFYRRTIDEMPSSKEEIEELLEEGIKISYLTTPVRILSEKGKIKGIECLKMLLGETDEDGRRKPVPITGSEYIIELDTLLVAIGEEPDLGFLLSQENPEISQQGTIAVNPETLETSLKGVFAGGDIVTGPSSVIEAMSAGNLASEMIDRYISGKPLVREYSVTRPSVYVPLLELSEEELEGITVPIIPSLPVSRRLNNFEEVELNMEKSAAVTEARRCQRCNLETDEGKKAFSG